MFDENAVRAELTKSDALRREAHLPSVDIEAGVARARAGYLSAAFWQVWQSHLDERKQIEAKVTAELRARHGQDFGYTWGGRWMIAARTNQQYCNLLAEKYGATRPKGPGPSFYSAVYGPTQPTH